MVVSPILPSGGNTSGRRLRPDNAQNPDTGALDPPDTRGTARMSQLMPINREGRNNRLGAENQIRTNPDQYGIVSMREKSKSHDGIHSKEQIRQMQIKGK